MPIVGLDLLGVESRPTGFCALADMTLRLLWFMQTGKSFQKSGKATLKLLPLMRR